MDPQSLQALLAWTSLPFAGERTLCALQDQAREGRVSLTELWEAPVDDLARLVRLHPRTREALDAGRADRWQAAGVLAREIREAGVDVLAWGDPEYPSVLPRASGGGRRWPLVFAYGALHLLEEPLVAVVNSSGATLPGLAATDAIADALARRDVGLVTSTNRESYQASAVAAKRHAGPTVMALDRSLAHAVEDGLRREPVAAARVWDAAFDPEVQLLLSPFAWGERWTARSGPRRDALIFDLATTVLAIDVRPDGTMARECTRTLESGRRVLALDRGADTPDGTAALLRDERCSGVSWKGADAAAEAVLRTLPSLPAARTEGRELQPWLREVGQFLARTCRHLTHRKDRLRPVVAAYPSGGALARVAVSWSAPEGDATRGVGWLLADLSAGATPARLTSLLARVERGGVLAALVPAAWLEAGEHAAARASWLQASAVRLIVRLPSPAEVQAEPRALVFLEPGGKGAAAAPVFAPDHARMGRFHLRRYLQEVLAALAAAVSD